MNEDSVPPPAPRDDEGNGRSAPADSEREPDVRPAGGTPADDPSDTVPDPSTGRGTRAGEADSPSRSREDSGGTVRRLTRAQDGKLITGVCAGLARYTRIDPVIFRVGFALLVLATGIGILLYVVAFLLMGAPDGGPSLIERAGKRIFDGDTALALLGAALLFGAVWGVAGNWGSGDALSVVVVFGLALLVARSRGVDLVQVARGLPESLKGRPLSSWARSAPPQTGPRLSDGMIDLARIGHRTDPYAAGAYGPATAPNPTPPYPPPAATADVPYGRRDTAPYIDFPARYDPPAPRRRSYRAALILLAAALVGTVLYQAADDRPSLPRLQIVMAGTLVVLALGACFGRDRKLVLVGAIMSFALASTSIAGNAAVARKTHQTIWRPVATAQAEQSHTVLIGQGVVDLTTVPLSPGERLQVSARVMVGVLDVKVPATARIEVDGHAFIGDITVDRRVTSGPGARVRRVLPPEGATPAASPTIVLHLRSKVGDMAITRVPA